MTSQLSIDVTDFSNSEFDAKVWINSVLKPSNTEHLEKTEDEIKEMTSMLVTKLQMTGESTSRQFDQLSNSVIKSMPRIKYEIKSIAEEARAIQRKIEAAKQKFEQLEKQTEPTLGQLRKPHTVKTRMEECQNLLDELKLEKSKPVNPVSEVERKTETTIQQDTPSLDPATILDLENPLQIYQNTQDNNNNNNSNNNNAQANNVFKKMGVPLWQ
ncbi:hypothetical protein RMCBS344292_12361 [Rhizopus microsporus]|nr:hypothetical protein RMCBS344292_12361 [Rhizopus microsporus]